MPSCERIRATCFISAGAGSPRRSVVIWIVSPWTVTSPEFGTSNRLIQRRSVLLPDPDAPSIEITSPVCATRDTPRSTSTLPKLLCKSSTTSAGSVAAECSNEIRQIFVRGYLTLTRLHSGLQSFCRFFLQVWPRYGLIIWTRWFFSPDREKDSNNDDQGDSQPCPGAREIVK